MRLRISRVLVLLFSACIAVVVQALEVPRLTGRVVDHAGLLGEASRNEITSQLQALEQSHGAQVAVLTVPGLQGEVLEDYSLRVAENWKLGRKGVDDGLLLLVARDDRKIRIEVGYGLEGVITDLDARRVIDNLMVPAFRTNDYKEGIQAAVNAISRTIRGEANAIPAQAVAREGPVAGAWMGLGFFSLFLIPFAWLAVALKAPQGWWMYAFMVPFSYGVPHMFGTNIALISVASWLLGAALLRLVWPEKWKIKPGSGGGSGGGYSGDGYSSRGSFSGGGGSFGGGGSSGSW